MSQINDVLNKMRKAGKLQDMKSKGDLGEDAVLSLCYARKKKVGNGLLYQSFTYPYQTARDGACYLGNIKYDTEANEFKDFTKDTNIDEIDVLYITPYRIFVIEVKSYGAKKLEINDHWFFRNSTPVDKSPITQAEKHARHLYHALNDVIPDGNPNYIVPLVCFVDKCRVVDNRSDHFQAYIPVCILNNFLSVINKNNVPMEYNLDLQHIERKLNEVKTGIKRVL